MLADWFMSFYEPNQLLKLAEFQLQSVSKIILHRVLDDDML